MTVAVPKSRLTRLFHPKSIAIVGASKSPEKVGFQCMAALRNFPGELFPINPAATEVMGRKAFARLSDVRKPIDLVIAAVPAAAIVKVAADSALVGAGGLFVVGGGFSEVGPAGAMLQAELVDVLRHTGVRVLGPNTSGFVNPFAQCCASFVPGIDGVTAGPLGIIAQSGGVNLTLAFLASQAGVGVSLAVGLGNACDVTAVDVLEHLASDDNTRAIALHLEGIGDGRRLYETLRRVTPIKPVAVLTVGRSDVKGFAQSHTGVLLGDFELKLAALRQAGAVVVDSTDALIDLCAAFTQSRLAPKSNPGVALVTGQAGPGLIIADQLRGAGVSLPTLGKHTREVVSGLLPPLTFIENPVDTGRPSATFSQLLKAVAADAAVDAVGVYALHEPEVLDVAEVAREYAKSTSKPLVYAGTGPTNDIESAMRQIRAAGAPTSGSPDRMARVLIGMVTDAKAQARIQTPASLRAPSERASSLALPLDEDSAKALLEDAGIPCPPRRVVGSREDAHRAMQVLGGNVAVKVVDATVRHKSDVGGVRLNVNGSSKLDEALDQIDQISRPTAQRYLIEAMAPPGLELIVGAVRDPSFGPVFLLGLGGVAAEAMRDVSRRIVPVSTQDVGEMLDELRGRALLDGWRGAPRVDKEAVIAASRVLTDLLWAHPEITEMEINPLRVYSKGVLALDALIA